MLKRGGAFVGARGFTLIELMVTITVLAILIFAVVPSLQAWIFNSRVRTAADSLQNGLRLAQAESVRQSRQVVFGLTNAAPALNATLVANGLNWTAQTVPIPADVISPTNSGARFIRGGPMADVTAGVTITGPQSICFGAIGNVATVVVAAALLPPGATCAARAEVYEIRHPSADRRLNVTVSLNGRVRMCDPAKPLATNPDGCV